jgi:hypothetical protein
MLPRKMQEQVLSAAGEIDLFLWIDSEKQAERRGRR